MRIYAIGDIHGQLEALRHAHALIEADGGGVIVHVGDLLDRGPDSRGVVDYLMRGQQAGRRWVIVKGNHDRFLPRFLTQPDWVDPGLSAPRHWLDHPQLGAAETLASYGVGTEGRSHSGIHADALRAVPQEQMRWLEGLPAWHLNPRGLFVHAGVRPGVGLQDQTEQDLVWIRRPFMDDPRDHGTLVIHGHTPVERPTHYGNRLNIDTGAGYGCPLMPVVLDDSGVHILTEAGRVPVVRA